MDAERYRRIRDIVVGALEVPPTARDTHLDRVCGADAELRREVETLLSAHPASDSLLDRGASDSAALRALVPDEEHPAAIGPYEIVEVLGEGGMGVVYRGRQDEPIRRDVAVKVLRRGLDTRRILERFAWERRSLARMDHPHIARILDAGTEATGRPYVVLELVDGVPITRWREAEDADEGAVVELMVRVCRAVQHAHDRGVLHRDLKPGNVLVRRVDGRAVPSIIDFGIAKALDPDDDILTQPGQAMGTPAYMSPEQREGDAAAIDVRSDVFALGVILHELLAGHRPGETPATGAVLRGDLKRICLMAVRPEPERRYGSAAALADDLERYRDGRPVNAAPDSPGYRLRKFVRRHPAAATLSAAAAVFAVAGVAFLAYHADRLERERRRAVEAEIVARNEAAAASGIAGFLEGLFVDTDAEQGAGGDITALELLDRGAERIERELQDQPLVRARLMRIMGRSRHSLADQEGAEQLLRRSLELIDAVPDSGAALADRVLVRQMLGTVLHDEAKYAEGEAMLREALELSGHDPAQTTLQGVVILADLAACVQAQGRLDEAVILLEASIAGGDDLGEPARREVAWSRNMLGYILYQQGRWREAHDLCGAALAVQRELAGADDLDLASSLNNVGGLKTRLGDLDGAERLLSEALALYRRVYRLDHPAVARGLRNLGSVARLRGDLVKAEELYRDGHAMMRRALGDDNAYTLVTAAGLGELLGDLGRHAEADSLSRHAVEGLAASLGHEHRRTREARASRCRILLAAGRHDLAEAELTALIADEADRLADDHPDLNILRTDLAAARIGAGRAAEVASLLRVATGHLDHSLGGDHAETRRARDLLRSTGAGP